MADSSNTRLNARIEAAAKALHGSRTGLDADECVYCEDQARVVIAAADAVAASECEKLRAARDECERQFQAKVEDINGLIAEWDALRAARAAADSVERPAVEASTNKKCSK